MLDVAARVDEADLPDLVRWAGAGAVGLLVAGPATAVALGRTPSAGSSLAVFLVVAFGPGVVAAVAAGAGLLRVPAGSRRRAWPAAAALALAVILPSAVAAWVGSAPS